MAETVRTLVRPVVTFAFTAAQTGLAVLWATSGAVTTDEGALLVTPAAAAFAGLLPLTLIIIRDWFASRERNGS